MLYLGHTPNDPFIYSVGHEDCRFAFLGDFYEIMYNIFINCVQNLKYKCPPPSDFIEVKFDLNMASV